MKTAQDPRHQKRREAVKNLFAEGYTHQERGSDLTDKIMHEIVRLDKEIENAAPAWPVNKLNRIDLAILRLAVYELLIEKDAPPKVIIDEAVELAKEFGSENSASFVNGVLGTIYKKEEIAKSE